MSAPTVIPSGSASALCSALRRCGKKAALYNNPDITPKYMKYIEQYVDADFAYDCAVAVDVAEKHMFLWAITARPMPVSTIIRQIRIMRTSFCYARKRHPAERRCLR